MKLPRFTKGQEITADDLNRLVEAINQALNLQGGPGIEVRKTIGGISVGLLNTRQNIPLERCSGGTLKELDHNPESQDTDTWIRDTDQGPVKFLVLTKVNYSLTTHQLTYRGRWIQTDKCGRLVEIGPESENILITEAKPCVEAT